jgi:vacuolar protein sorting-associated protein 13A/C
MLSFRICLEINFVFNFKYVIDTHHLVDVDIRLMSSYIVLPHGGTFTESSACTIANLGSISVKSNPISAETRSLKDMSLKDLTDAFKSSLRDQVYDKFQVSLENIQVKNDR